MTSLAYTLVNALILNDIEHDFRIARSDMVKGRHNAPHRLSPGTGSGRRQRAKPVSFATVQKIALALPGVEEGLSYGTPAFRVRGKFLARLREDGGTLVLKTDFDTQEALMAADPETFSLTDHYRGYPVILVRLSSVHAEDLRKLFETAWRRNAPRRLVDAFEKRPKTGP